jgi:ethanolamine permease
MVSGSSGDGHGRAHAGFFEKRQLRRYAGIWSLWALGVGAVHIARWALNIGADGTELTGGSGPLFPFGMQGVLAALPFAVWLYPAIEELPLAAEESIDPRRDMPRGILAVLVTLTVTAFLIAAINPALSGVGAYKLGT